MLAQKDAKDQSVKEKFPGCAGNDGKAQVAGNSSPS